MEIQKGTDGNSKELDDIVSRICKIANISKEEGYELMKHFERAALRDEFSPAEAARALCQLLRKI